MSEHVYQASETLKNIRRVEVSDIRGNVDDGKVDHWQITTKIGSNLADGAGR